MKDIKFLLAIVLIIGLLWIVVQHYQKESFTVTTLEEKIQDRFNPFTGLVDLNKNPIAPLGVSPSDAKALRALHKTALNIPEGFTNDITVPLTTSEDMLGLSKMCKEKAATLSDPFSDPDFAAQCGVCMTEGTYYDGSTFNAKRDGRAAGLLVYDKRKAEATAVQASKGYAFPHATPFVFQNKNTCLDATESEDAQPVFAITGETYHKLKQRKACIHEKTLGTHGSQGCAVCQTTKQYTWLDPVQTPNRSVFVLFGRGLATVRVNGVVKGQDIPLQMSQGSEVVLGGVKEGSSIEVLVKNTDPKDTEASFIYIALKGTNAAPNATSMFDAFPFFTSDLGNATDKTILKLGRRQFPGLSISLVGMKASKQTTTDAVNSIHLDGVLPLTFIDSANTVGAYDCPTSPLMTLTESAEKLFDDPCLRNKQGPGSYSDACLKSLITESGPSSCTALGDLVKKPTFTFQGKQTTLRNLAGNKTKGDFVTFVQKEIAANADTDPELSLLCTGKDISTPCDAELKNPSADPNAISQACLVYLYNNQTRRVGLPYGSTSLPFQSADAMGNPMFCQRSGLMNPETPAGLALFRAKIKEIGHLRGIDAVKETLKKVFTRATSDLPIEKEDSEGGRATSYRLCLNKEYPQPVPKTVSRLADGTLPATRTDALACNTRVLSDTFRPQKGRSLLNSSFPIYMKQNFTCSFLLQPTGVEPQWSNLLRFGKAQNDSTLNMTGDCCTFGQRALGIWFFPNETRMHIRIGHTNNGNWGIDTDALQMNKTYQVVVEAKDTLVTVRVTEVNRDKPFFQKTANTSSVGSRYEGWVSVWGSDPYYPAARAVVSELCFQ